MKKATIQIDSIRVARAFRTIAHCLALIDHSRQRYEPVDTMLRAICAYHGYDIVKRIDQSTTLVLGAKS